MSRFIDEIIKQADQLRKKKKGDPTRDVVIVFVKSDGTVFPQHLIVKRDGLLPQVVLWATDGQKLGIDFKRKNSSPPLDVSCSAGPFCHSKPVPKSTRYQTYKYTATVDGKDYDPELEVVP